MLTLQDNHSLLQRAKALAALDLIFLPEWEYRYYSFDSLWDEQESVASMRNGSGDEWWILFHAGGWAALKGLAHESQAWSEGQTALSDALREVIPEGYNGFSSEPAFNWDSTSFSYLYTSADAGWQRVNDLTEFSSLDSGEDELFRHFVNGADEYRAFVSEYYERDVPVALIKSIFDHAPITNELVSSLNPDVDFKDIVDELYGAIAYPR